MSVSPSRSDHVADACPNESPLTRSHNWRREQDMPLPHIQGPQEQYARWLGSIWRSNSAKCKACSTTDHVRTICVAPKGTSTVDVRPTTFFCISIGQKLRPCTAGLRKIILQKRCSRATASLLPTTGSFSPLSVCGVLQSAPTSVG